VVGCVLSDPLVSAHVLQMAEHERSTAAHMFIVTTLAVLLFLLRTFSTFIDFITALGFLTAPVVALLNHRVMFSTEVTADRRPAAWLRYWSVAGIVVLAFVFPIYLYFQVT
jgi:Mn2+/Fe2+ NRAMP family transporter